MPKRILSIALAAIALGLVACNSNTNINALYGTPQPTSTATLTPDPSATAAIITVTLNGSPMPNQPVTLSNDLNGTIGTTIKTQNTDSSGTTTFNGLTGAANYCFSSVYTPTTVGATQQTPSYCGPYWGHGTVVLQFTQ